MPPPQGRQAAARSGRWRRIFKLCSDLNSQPKRPDLDLWPFDLESGVRVTCDVGYLSANFSLGLCSRLYQRVHPSRVMWCWLVLLIINAVIGGYLRQIRWSITFYETQTKQSDILSIFSVMCSTVQTINKFNSNKNRLALLLKMSLNYALQACECAIGKHASSCSAIRPNYQSQPQLMAFTI